MDTAVDGYIDMQGMSNGRKRKLGIGQKDVLVFLGSFEDCSAFKYIGSLTSTILRKYCT